MRVFLWLALASGVAMHAWIVVSQRLGALDQDESIVGLMALQVAQGEIPAFFWGQSYGGTAQVFLIGGLSSILGETAVVGRIVSIGLHGLGTWLTWRIGLRIVDRRVAAIAAALAWTWPTFAVWWAHHLHGFYPMSLVLGLLVVLLALRLAEVPNSRDALLAGLAVGLAVWTSPQTLFLIIPVLIWLLFERPIVLRWAPVAVGSALLGALPLIWSNLLGESQSFSNPLVARSLSDYWDTLRGLFVQPIPAALGMRVSGSPKWVLGEITGLALYMTLLVGLWQSFSKRMTSHNIIWCVVIGYIGLLALSEHAAYRAEPRYLYLIMPLLALLIAQVAKDAGIPILLPVLLTALSWLGLGVMHNFPKDPIVPADFTPVVAALEDKGLNRVFAYHTIAYRIAFESQEEIIATPIDHVRYPPFNRLVRESSTPAYVFAPVPEVADAFEEELRLVGVPYSAYEAGDFDIIVPGVKTAPEQFEALSQ